MEHISDRLVPRLAWKCQTRLKRQGASSLAYFTASSLAKKENLFYHRNLGTGNNPQTESHTLDALLRCHKWVREGGRECERVRVRASRRPCGKRGDSAPTPTPGHPTSLSIIFFFCLSQARTPSLSLSRSLSLSLAYRMFLMSRRIPHLFQTRKRWTENLTQPLFSGHTFFSWEEV